MIEQLIEITCLGFKLYKKYFIITIGSECYKIIKVYDMLGFSQKYRGLIDLTLRWGAWEVFDWKLRGIYICMQPTGKA